MIDTKRDDTAESHPDGQGLPIPGLSTVLPTEYGVDVA
jgi:hypothetical protein